MAPRAPWIGAEGQFEGHEREWRTANTQNHAYLEYKSTSNSSGQPVPPPTRNTFEPPVQAIMSSSAQSAQDIMQTTGIFQASLGEKSNEISGTAIQRRVRQAETSNFHLSDNARRSIKHGGRIVVDLIPRVYDTKRAVRMLGEDGTQEIVTINGIFQRNGKDTLYELNKGKYDVTVDTGPSFQTKRQEAVASMLDLIKADPEIARNIMDLLVKNMDWPGAQKIAERLQKLLPPGLLEKDGKQKEIPPEIQQQIQQMAQQLQQMSQIIDEQHKVIDTKKVETDSKERIAFAQMKNNLTLELMKHDAKHAQTAFIAETDFINQKMAMIPQETNPTGGATPGQQP